jgi:hypothetical protein
MLMEQSDPANKNIVSQTFLWRTYIFTLGCKSTFLNKKITPILDDVLKLVYILCLTVMGWGRGVQMPHCIPLTTMSAGLKFFLHLTVELDLAIRSIFVVKLI